VPHDAQRALDRAREHTFVSGVGDAGEGLCAANMPYGIAKIQEVQRQLGLPQDATFIGAPDATVTRNSRRWTQGFGYGGRLQWTGDFAVLDIKSNACGMIVAALSEAPPFEQIRERARKLVQEPLVVDGIAVEFDLGEGNHFLDLCRVRSTDGTTASNNETLAIIHSSGHEHRERTPHGPGIYYDASEELQRMAERRDTPWGPLHVLRGEDGARWHEIYQWVQRFSLARREALARALLDDLDVVCNRTHQGLLAVNDAILGCYCFDDDDLERGQLFPLTLSPELPAYLVQPRPNLSAQALEKAGFAERAERHGLSDRLARANVLPHGGGYSYSQYRGVSRVLEDGEIRRFEMVRPDGRIDVVEDVRAAAYGYRGDEVRRRMVELDLGTPRVELEITYVLRT
jgi:hypothetical protein